MSLVNHWAMASLLMASSGVGSALAGQEPACTRRAELTLEEVTVVGVNAQTGALLGADTIWIPSEGMLGDSLYVRLSMSAPAAGRGDSVYAIAALRLQWHALQQRDREGPVELPSRAVVDTTVPLTPHTTLILGPFSTNHLIPWPGIAVDATANANPTGIAAEAGVLQVTRAGSTCTENLVDNRKRSRIVTIQYSE
jgi:hypothetical protein